MNTLYCWIKRLGLLLILLPLVAIYVGGGVFYGVALLFAEDFPKMWRRAGRV